jgi:adenylylsulfate kinase-like enzyme
MNPIIQITVASTHCGGKSTIALIIAEHLASLGFNTQVLDDNGTGVVEDIPGQIKQTINPRVESMLVKNPAISVQTKSIPVTMLVPRAKLEI